MKGGSRRAEQKEEKTRRDVSTKYNPVACTYIAAKQRRGEAKQRTTEARKGRGAELHFFSRC